MQINKIGEKITIKPSERKIKKIKSAIKRFIPEKNKSTIYIKPQETFLDKVKGKLISTKDKIQNFVENYRKQG